MRDHVARQRGSTHMEDDVRNGIIVDAKRRAKAHSKSTGESHQRSLDRIAQLRGRDDWKAFIDDPVAERLPEEPMWVKRMDAWCVRHRKATIWIVASFLVTSVVMLNAVIAQINFDMPYHVPMMAWLPIAAVWAAMAAHVAFTMVRESILILKELKSGMIEAQRVWILVWTIIVIIMALEGWTTFSSNESSPALLASSIGTMILVEYLLIKMFSSPPGPGMEFRAGRKCMQATKRVRRPSAETRVGVTQEGGRSDVA
jgi:hypothetical protein